MKLVMYVLYACLLSVMLLVNVRQTFADSLRLPGAQREEVSKPVISGQGASVVVPDIVDKTDVIVTSPETIVLPGPEEGKTTEIDMLERPEMSDNIHSSPDNTILQAPAPAQSPNNLPLPDGRANAPIETDTNMDAKPVVPTTTQRTTLTIEDILADPMKNKDKKSSKNDSLSLPKDTQAMDFLEGKWLCETDLINLENDAPVVIDFMFDKNGKGKASLKEKTGRVFTGAANARLKNGVLDIKVAKLVTPESSASYNGSDIQCKQKGTTAICSGKNTGTPPVIWKNATFHRVK